MKKRLFTAIEIPEASRLEIQSLQSRLSKFSDVVDWQPPENLHITLNFLGRVDQSRVNMVQNAMKAAVEIIEPFSLIPTFLDTLYMKHERTAVYLSIGGDLEGLKKLQKILVEEFSKRDVLLPIRYMPHITIGKIKRSDPTTTKQIMDKLADFESQPLSPFTVDKISLFESLLSRSGSHYQKVHTIKIPGAPLLNQA